MAGDISDWFKSIPIITRGWFGLSVVLPLLGRFGILNPMWMILEYSLVVKRFQIWRPITALFYYPISPQTGFHFLINLYFLYSYSTRLEEGAFFGRPADYLMLLIINWAVLVVIGLGFGLYLLMDPMVISVLYVWCQLNKDQIVQFWFGTQFKAMYLPWILAAFNMVLMGGGVMELIGIVVGHVYFFLAFQYPQEYGGISLVKTPAFLYTYLPNRARISGFGVPPASRRRADDGGGGGGGGGGHNWGQGNRMDD